MIEYRILKYVEITNHGETLTGQRQTTANKWNWNKLPNT